MCVLQGLPAGQYSLGRCLERGEGTQKAPADAVHWYRLAVDASYAPAIEAMGTLLFWIYSYFLLWSLLIFVYLLVAVICLYYCVLFIDCL
jgi:TPR repeat protein